MYIDQKHHKNNVLRKGLALKVIRNEKLSIYL